MKCVGVYKELYHQEPFDVAFCPYRISPLGAHIDHQYGKINGLAIDKGIHMAYHPKQNGVVELQSLNFPKRAQFFVSAVPEEKQGDWADHLRGAAKMLGEKYRLKVGLSGIIEGSLPIGGLSSSASVIICFLSALCKVNGIHLEPMEMILTAKAAENQYVGVSCGKLDQSCEVLSKKNHLLYSRKTKLGRVEWNPGTLAGVLANERHCGDVLARKTFTPNFLTHKSKKNNNDRTQYRQKNHHEAIVSREVFNAANHLRASRNYSKKDRPLPVLSVVEDGILRGYVPFDKDWTGFSAEEYREASESVMKEPDVTVTADVKKRLDLTGYEIVRVQYFSTMQNPAMTISNGRLRFNTACLKKFENVEYVELLLNSVERCIAIRPCDKNNPNAIRWGRLKEGRWCASTLGCRGLAKTLFDIMEWDEDLRYRFRGQFLEQGDNKMMLFAFDEPEMIKVEEIVLPPKENTEEDEGETVKKKIYIFPPEWAGTFGQPITSIAQVGILRQEHYAGNWDVFRPATEIEEMNIFTAESLNELLREAEKIMEGWTDYR